MLYSIVSYVMLYDIASYAMLYDEPRILWCGIIYCMMSLRICVFVYDVSLYVMVWYSLTYDLPSYLMCCGAEWYRSPLILFCCSINGL